MLTYKEKWGKTYAHTVQSMVQRRNYSQHAAVLLNVDIRYSGTDEHTVFTSSLYTYIQCLCHASYKFFSSRSLLASSWLRTVSSSFFSLTARRMAFDFEINVTLCCFSAFSAKSSASFVNDSMSVSTATFLFFKLATSSSRAFRLRPDTSVSFCLFCSRIFFQDFPGPWASIFRTFQDQSDFPGLSRSWIFQEKKSRTFQEAWEPCTGVVVCLTAALQVHLLAGQWMAT